MTGKLDLAWVLQGCRCMGAWVVAGGICIGNLIELYENLTKSSISMLKAQSVP